ncbi:MAG: hypothetical protein P8L44_19830, partial [Opitutales bacterium]|nr:hypothetical protein [Opitutales bacterium]
RLKVGYEAEIIFPALPGKVFKGKVSHAFPATLIAEKKKHSRNYSPHWPTLGNGVIRKNIGMFRKVFSVGLYCNQRDEKAF